MSTDKFRDAHQKIAKRAKKEPQFTAKEKKKIFLVNQEVNRSLSKLNKRHQKDVQSAEWLKKELLEKYASAKDDTLKVCIEVSIARLEMQTNARYQEIYSVTRILGGEKKAAVI